MKKNLPYIITALAFALIALFFSVFIFFQIRGAGEGDGTAKPPEGGSFGGLAPEEQPLGGSSTGTTPEPPSEEGSTATPVERELPALRQLSANPVSGATLYTLGAEFRVRYIERGNGHLFDVHPYKDETVRISQTTIPKVYEALWYANASSTILRLIDAAGHTTENFAATVAKKAGAEKEEGGYTIQGGFLEKGVRSLTRLGDTEQSVAYVVPGATESIIYTLAKGGTPKIRGEVLGTEWQVEWPTDNTIYLTTNAASVFDGYLYALRGTAKEPVKILGPKKGLTTLASPSGKLILYSESTGRGFSLHLYDVEKGVSSPLNLRTLPEKCVWSGDTSFYCGTPGLIYAADYPEVWYQGQLNFYDTIFRYTVDTGTTTSVADYSVLRQPMDITAMDLSKDGSYLIFTNKIDGRLWGLDLKKL